MGCGNGYSLVNCNVYVYTCQQLFLCHGVVVGCRRRTGLLYSGGFGGRGARRVAVVERLRVAGCVGIGCGLYGQTVAIAGCLFARTLLAYLS